MKIEFRDADCRWRVPEFEGVKPHDELHVKPNTDVMLKNLALAMETSEKVVCARGFTRYKVLREVDGTFVLVNARGIREGNSRGKFDARG